jgi:glucose-1-phosphate adenylyltransferase
MFVHDVEGRRGMGISSLVSGGCIVSGAVLHNSLLCDHVHVHSWCDIDHGVLLPYADVGRHARLRNVIVDAGVRIPPGLVVGEDPPLDAARFRRTERGNCLNTQSMLDRLMKS